jgi:hypothetical protein
VEILSKHGIVIDGEAKLTDAGMIVITQSVAEAAVIKALREVSELGSVSQVVRLRIMA